MSTRPAEVGDVEWMERGLCRTEGHDVDLFFPNPNQFGKAARAKAVCARCDVRETCLAHALENGERHGIFGGTSERQRQRMRGKTGPLKRTRAPDRPVRGFPTTVYGAAIRELLADGDWHTLDEVVAHAIGDVPRDKALLAFNNLQRSRARTIRAIPTSMTDAVGGRIVIRSVLGNMASREQIERDGQGACRLVRES